MAESEKQNSITEPSHSDTDLLQLSDFLERGRKMFEDVDSTSEPLGSTAVQANVKRAIQMLEEASSMVAQLDLFSRNEELEEVSTADVKYLLLPALLGALHMKLTSRESRLHAVQAARTYFMDFLRRCKEFHICHFELPTRGDEPEEESSSEHKSVPAAPSDLVSMAAKRQSKIERYRQRKELEARLSDVQKAVDGGQADDEVTRDFYLLTVRRWVAICLEEMETIDQEVELLRNMDVLKHGHAKHPAQHARHPMKPFILTKDAVQARVFGAGYPSLATMTVNDWYEQHAKHGVLPDQGVPRRVAAEDTAAEERESEEKERKAENDDEESLQKARNWDDWKDTHRRGYGNRQNMG